MIKSPSLSPGEELSPTSDWNGVRTHTIDEYSSDIFEGTDDTQTPNDPFSLNILIEDFSPDYSPEFLQTSAKKKKIKFSLEEPLPKEEPEPKMTIPAEKIQHNPLYNSEKLKKFKALDSSPKEDIHVNPLFKNPKLRTLENTSPNTLNSKSSISPFNIFRRKSNPYETQNIGIPPSPLVILRKSLRRANSASALLVSSDREKK